MAMRCHSVFEDHSSSAFFQARCVATESTVIQTVTFRLTLLRVRTNEPDDSY